MAKSKKKIDSKTYAQQKRHRRQWVTFMRMCRYGANNFTRNAWLTVAATAVMTITLFVVFASIVSRNVLVDTVDVLKDKVDMSIYVKTDTKPAAVSQITTDLKKLSSVTSVEYVSAEQARAQLIEKNKTDASLLSAVTEASNKLPGTFNIKVKDINDTQQLRDFVANNATLKDNLSTIPPSFAGNRRQAIEQIGNGANFALQVGIILSIVFIGMSMLIIFNTIRMAIFNRREEIQMMKLIGAEKSFIRGPFIVEAIVYGFFAAVVATVLGYVLLFSAAPALATAQISIRQTLLMAKIYAPIVVLAMILIGAFIGIISSLMATRRYLRL